MAPSNSCALHKEAERLPGKEKNKLRKPVVEKMRRDRINNSIEQLKVLLEREFQRHQPNSKLEKADILEVAVSYLQQQQQIQRHVACGQKNPEFDFNTGYLRCLREAMHFLSLCEPKKETQAQLLRHFCKVRVSAEGANPSAAVMRCLPPSPSACPPSKPKTASKNPSNMTAAIWRPW